MTDIALVVEFLIGRWNGHGLFCLLSHFETLRLIVCIFKRVWHIREEKGIRRPPSPETRYYNQR